MKEIIFYRTPKGKCPVEEFLDALSEKQARKITWILRLIRETDQVSADYFKKLVNTSDIWEVRMRQDKLSIRIFGFFYKNKFIVLTNGFIKKSQKTTADEIHLAKERRKDFLSRR